MSEVLARAVEGLAEGLPQAVFDFYRDRSEVPAQYELAFRRDLEKLDRDYESRRHLAAWETTLRVTGDLEVARATAELSYNPFGYRSDEDVLDTVRWITSDAKRPALLLAPFVKADGSTQENIDKPYGYIHSLRESWRDSSWRDDMEANVGLINKPLLQTDENLRHIRAVLAALPVVLVYGVVGETGKVRLEIVAWNIIGGPDSRPDGACIEIAISGRAADISGPGELSGQLSHASTQLCAMLAEWFHVARGHRPPRRHRDIAEGLRPATATGTLVALGLGAERYGMDPVIAAVHQAVVYADHGDIGQLACAIDCVRRTADPDQAERQLRFLQETFTRAAATGTCSPPNADAVAKLIGDELDSASIRLNRSRLYG